MPNQPRGGAPTPHARPIGRGRGASPARVVVAAAAVIGLLAIVGSIAAGALGPAGSPAPVAAVTLGPSSPAVTAPPATPATTPTVAPSPTLAPTATPSPTPVASPSPTASASLPPVPARKLQAKLDALRAKLSIPGVSVAIVWDDGRRWLGVSGLADVGRGRAVTRGSGFALASISKTFTAAVVLQLVDEGRLSLEERVARRLPAFGLDRRITVRMLLDHTSGLPDFFLSRRIDAALQSAPDATWTPARSWSYVAKKRPVPGTTWAYSNTNYLLLGELVEAVTGHPLASEVRDRLLDPLGLPDTWYQVAEKPRATLTAGYRLVAKAGGIRAVRVAPVTSVMPFRSVITAAGGAGSIAATALDTARWMQAFAGGRVLSPGMQREMLADVARTTALKARIPYGLGIQSVVIAGRPALGHSGRYLGFRNVVRYLPAEGVTIAVLTNQNAKDPARIAAALLNLALPPSPSPSASPSAAP